MATSKEKDRNATSSSGEKTKPKEADVRIPRDPWAGHRGTWATFEKLNEKYWWPSMYKNLLHFVCTCESCQVHSNIRHRDELQPTYPLTIHFKWMVDLVSMPMGVGQMKYLVLAREDLTNQVEGRALTNKTTAACANFYSKMSYVDTDVWER